MGSFGSTVELPEAGHRPEHTALLGMHLYGGMYTVTGPVIRSGPGRVYGAKDTLGRAIFLTVCAEAPLRHMDLVDGSQVLHDQEDGPRQQVGFVLQEANCLSERHHPNIVALHQAFAYGQDAALTTDTALGSSLREVIDHPDRRLGPEQIISIACIMLDAISSIHALGLLHGDVSVDTILLDAKDEPFLVDFGAVRRPCTVPMDMTDALEDTPAVEDSAPDPACGPWRDLRGLAVALHHAITGKPIAEADRVSAAPVAMNPMPRLAGTVVGYPPGFLECIDTALETLPAASFQSAEEWLDELKGLLRQKDPNLKLLEKALGLRRPKPTASSTDPMAAVVDAAAELSSSDVDPTVDAEDPTDIAADQVEAASNSTTSLLPPQQLMQEGPQIAVDLSGLKEISGFIAGCLVDCESGLMLASELVGKFDIETAAAANVDVVRGKQTAVKLLGLNDSIEDILITLSTQLHLIRPLEGAPNLFLYAALDRKVANLGMARLQVKKVEQSITI